MKVHSLRSVRILSALVAAASLALGVAYAKGPKGPTIVDVAIAVNAEGDYAGSFDTLIAAVLAADPAVAATLTGNGQHTVFAPTDDAFAELGISTDEDGNLVAPPSITTEALTEVLLYHVAKGRRDAEDITGSTQVRTLLGERVYQSEGALTDRAGLESPIIVTDVEAANGIIHVIDGVLLPFIP